MEFSIRAEKIRINVPDKDALVARVRRLLETGQGFAVATLNLDHIVKMAASPEFARAYAGQDLVVADGHPIAWLSRLSGHPVGLAPGSELIEPLCGVAEITGAPVALVGTTPQALQAASGELGKRLPDLKICATISPSRAFDPDGPEADQVLVDLERSGARLCFVALGAPKQERFAARARGVLPQVGFVSVGAGLDFIAGQEKRAPLLVRRLALEWLWRTLQNPARMAPRYARCFLVLPKLTLMALHVRWRRPKAG